jgi:hypothetical protein
MFPILNSLDSILQSEIAAIAPAGQASLSLENTSGVQPEGVSSPTSPQTEGIAHTIPHSAGKTTPNLLNLQLK